MWSGFQCTCHLNALLTPPTPPASPLTPLPAPWCPYTHNPFCPLNPYTSCHPMPPDTPISLPAPKSYTPASPMIPPDFPSTLPVRMLGPWTEAQCGKASSLPATPMPLTPLHALPVPKPYTPCKPPDFPSTLPVRMLGPWTGARCGQAPSQPATPYAPIPYDTPSTP